VEGLDGQEVGVVDDGNDGRPLALSARNVGMSECRNIRMIEY
jgi:hypothetical protein